MVVSSIPFILHAAGGREAHRRPRASEALTAVEEHGFVIRDKGTRVLRFAKGGEEKIKTWLALGPWRRAA
jgi:hypothetical protein